MSNSSRHVNWKCLNPDCGIVFSARYTPESVPPHWQWCPTCHASSTLKSTHDTYDARAALAAKDAEVASLRARLAKAEAVVEAAAALLRSDTGRELLHHEPEVGLPADTHTEALADAVAAYDAAKEGSDG